MARPLPIQDAGMGRIVRFHEPQSLTSLADRTWKMLLPNASSCLCFLFCHALPKLIFPPFR